MSIEAQRPRSTEIPERFREGIRRSENGIGLHAEYYTQPESVGFSQKAIQEARKNKVLSGSVIIIVGAGDVGGATALEAASQGAESIVITTTPKLNPEREELLLKEMKKAGATNSLWIEADITSSEDRENVINETVSNFGRIDGMVITPADPKISLLLRNTPEERERLLKINFIGPIELLASTVKQMTLKQKPPGGRIVMVSSPAALGSPGQTMYSAGKAGIDSFVKSASREGLDKRNVFMNVVAPGLTDTRMVANVQPEQREIIKWASFADRELRPNEPAELIAHLLAPNRNINGKVIPIIGRN